MVRTEEGYRVRTILTRPEGASGRLPAVLFVQWLSCDPVEVPAEGGDGWARMLREVMTGTGMVFARTEKPGLGESEGPPCDQLDYLTELSAHRAALGALRASPWVDPGQIFIFGASMGGTMAPLLAAADPGVRGVVVWGATGVSWLEHMLLLNRRVLELSDTSPGELAEKLASQARLQAAYLAEGRDPREIVASDPSLAQAWRETLGAEERTHYGRPFAFHHQAQRAGWEGAWASVRVPVLVVSGEYDWIMAPEEHERIASIVNRSRPGSARLVTVPGTDHHFDRYASPGDAFAGSGGTYTPEPARVIIEWLRDAARGG